MKSAPADGERHHDEVLLLIPLKTVSGSARIFSENFGQNLALDMPIGYLIKGYSIANVLLGLPLLCQCSHIVQGRSLISGLKSYLPHNNHGKREGEKEKNESATFCPNSDLRFPTSWYLISHRVTNG